jgi:CRP/FNR family cyclic AMP-dependent transcriptional regulator
MSTGPTMHPFLAGLRPGLLGQLIGSGTAVSYPAGHRIFTEGGPANAFWLIERGTVTLDLNIPGRGTQVIETISDGSVLGWSWLYPPYRWQFGAVTSSPVTALEFDAASVRARCDEDTAFGSAILHGFIPVLADRLHTTRLRLLDLWSRP